jgi:N12 class adenine-specific DNA methylase
MGTRRHAVADDGRQLDFFTFSAPVRPLGSAEMPTGTLARAVTGEASSFAMRGPSLAPSPTASESSGAEIPSAPVVAPLAKLTLPPVPAVTPPQDYRITDADRLGEGSLAQKTRANLDALTLLNRLDAEQRPATEAEQRVLVRYVGWGGLPQVFDPRNAAWAKPRAELQGLLTEAEFASARATTLNAHYTPPTIIRAMYALLERLGFQGGRVLEPACGLGHFLGLMPAALRERSAFTAIEIDPVTARLAQRLYPGADIRPQPFEESRLADDFYDVAISNVPFGDYRPFDPRSRANHFLIHDYFFAAALAKVRPGGLLLFLTSKGTLDKADATLRAHLDQSADFVGALRLPNTAFKRNANTEVTTDLVVLRKRLPGEARAGQPWRELRPITNSLGETIAVNEWYAAHPGRMLGELRLSGRMYRHAEPTLVATGDLEAQLAEAIGHFPAGVFSPVERPPPPLEVSPVPASAELKPNAFTLLNGELARREGDQVVRLTGLPAATAARLRGLIRVRDAIRHCLQTQWENRPEEEITQARLALNQTYERFVAKFGPVSDRRNTAAFRGDPDLPLLLSVEHYDRESVRATKAALFHERTITQRAVTVEVTDAKSALLVTLNERGRVDLEFLGRLLRKTPAECLPDLQGLIFLNPQSRTWETDDAYLSGNVKAKLAAAEAAALTDPQFAANVAALRTVQPADLTATEIDARLGSGWLPPEDLARFAAELLGDGIAVEHAAVIGTWSVRGRADVRGSVANTAEWGTERRGALDLLEDALNLRTPTIYDYDAPNDRMVLNGAATEAARDKQQKLKDRFQEWVWREDDRRERLLRIYNDQFNCVRLRTFNGDHLALPGASSAVDLRGHQKAGVWRILQTPNTLLAHVVGAGKTYTMVAAALELRRLGLARKPLFTVPNHMLEQFAAELLTLYPAANILVASKEDFEKQRRQTLMSRIATGNWDAVIVTHSGFEKIPLSRDTRERFFTEQLEELADAILQQKANDDRGSRIVKELEQAKKRLETKLKELLAEDRKDDGLTFEQLGVDRLFVDEAHCFKNLFYVSKMTRLAGLPQTASQRALDMFLKVRHVQQGNGGGGVVFATGTPIANSVAEMFTMQRYLQMTALKALHVDHFDAWAGTFGEPVTAMELSPDGAGYRLNTRFARFINVPELMAQFRQVADIRTRSMLNLPIPRLRGERPSIVRSPGSPALKEIVRTLVARAEAIRRGSVKANEDNMLLVTTDGRKAALDLRLYDPALGDEPDSKVNRAAEEVTRIWRETIPERSTQLVFCDLSTPTGGQGFSVYEDLRAKLVAAGVPLREIAFIQDFDSDAAKAGLFRDVKAGRVRVLLGSTSKMGSGTNVQARLIALHHLDAPWRPADVEQREGRILRQGNSNAEVQIYRYVTEGSFDAYMWQTLETKAKFIAQIMTGDTSLRRLEDVDGSALTYAEVKAIASGNPLVIEKANVDAEVARLTRLRSQHFEAQYSMRSQVRHLADDIPRLERRLEALRADLAARVDTRGDRFVIELGNDIVTERGIAGELLNRWGDRLKATGLERKVGRFAGFEVFIGSTFTGEAQVVLKGAALHSTRLQPTAVGTMRSVEHLVASLEDSLAQTESNLSQCRRRSEDLQVQAGQPFEYADKLVTLSLRQQELVAALDLTKGQATASAEAEGDLAAQSASEEPEAGSAREGDWSW